MQPGSIHSALGPPSGNGLAHQSLLTQQTKIGDSIPPPLVGVAPPIDYGRSAVTHGRRWCQGGSLDQGEPVGGGRVDGGSPQRRLHDGGARPVGKRRR
jgi:hypothetical protein